MWPGMGQDLYENSEIYKTLWDKGHAYMKSEFDCGSLEAEQRFVGKALRELIDAGRLRREEVFLAQRSVIAIAPKAAINDRSI